MDNLKTVTDYAKEKDISVQAVYQAIKRGSVDFKKIGKTILVRCR
jgi:predicted DNA-binding protein YlxM (UPF0122 family)